MKSKKKEPKPVDEVRETILRFFYDKHKNASSPKKARLKISDAKAALLEIGITGKEAVSNIDYLVDGGWLKKEVEEKEFVTAGGVRVPSKTPYYKSSNQTIDHFDKGQSIFKKNDIGGINITNIQGVTAVNVGDSNQVIVNASLAGAHADLEALKEATRQTNQITDQEKLDTISDIETIQAQTKKTAPNKSIIANAWSGLVKLAKIGGKIADLYGKIKPIIEALIK